MAFRNLISAFTVICISGKYFHLIVQLRVNTFKNHSFKWKHENNGKWKISVKINVLNTVSQIKLEEETQHALLI